MKKALLVGGAIAGTVVLAFLVTPSQRNSVVQADAAKTLDDLTDKLIDAAKGEVNHRLKNPNSATFHTVFTSNVSVGDKKYIGVCGEVRPNNSFGNLVRNHFVWDHRDSVLYLSSKGNMPVEGKEAWELYCLNKSATRRYQREALPKAAK